MQREEVVQQALVGGQRGGGVEAGEGGHQGGSGHVGLDAVVDLRGGQVLQVLQEERAGEGEGERTEGAGRGERVVDEDFGGGVWTDRDGSWFVAPYSKWCISKGAVEN